MSRHQLSPRVVVGWDQPLQTYFAHVYDHLGAQKIVARVGGEAMECYDLEQFRAKCPPLVRDLLTPKVELAPRP